MKRILFVIVCVVLASCKTKVVTVPEVHEHWHHTTDTIERTDSVIDHQTTIVREVDSATMARFGIELNGMQKAWLVETDRLQRELSALRETRTDTIIERDSIPVPYPVEKEVPAQLSKWQKVKMGAGSVALIGGGLVLVLGLLKLKKKILP